MSHPVRAHARFAGSPAALTASLLLSSALSTAVWAAPPIRTSEDNRVPSCVSPERLMAFLKDRNETLDPRYRDIAQHYKRYGEQWNVRWDYAFYQMLLETNYLKYRRGNGRRGDVHEKQNNFAGIGATGGGVAGERFPDIKTGVHAQIQHLVAYSGETVQNPVARRTDENQDSIIAQSRRLNRAVTFGDLARRWAADRQYAKSIDVVATMFREGYCKGPAPRGEQTADATGAIDKAFVKPAHLGGPKPQRLAGPETLPWDGESIATERPDVTAEEGNTPAKTAEPRKSGPPVRTLWSKQKGYEGEPDRRAPETAAPEEDAPAAISEAPAAGSAEKQSATARASEQARPAGAVHAGGDTGEAAGSIELPTFRIAPRTPEPSKLGGPVDETAELPDPAAAAPSPAMAMTSPSSGASPSSPAAAAPEPTAVPPQGTLVEYSGPEPITREVRQAAVSAVVPGQSAVQGDCRILSASYGGKKTLLVHADRGGVMQLTALTVLDGFEESMLKSYAKSQAPGAKVLGTYASKAEALNEAKAICPSG